MIKKSYPEQTLYQELMTSKERQAYDFAKEAYDTNLDNYCTVKEISDKVMKILDHDSDFYCSDCDRKKRLVDEFFKLKLSSIEEMLDTDEVCIIDADNKVRHRLGLDLIQIEDEDEVRERLQIEYPVFE